MAERGLLPWRSDAGANSEAGPKGELRTQRVMTSKSLFRPSQLAEGLALDRRDRRLRTVRMQEREPVPLGWQQSRLAR